MDDVYAIPCDNTVYRRRLLNHRCMRCRLRRRQERHLATCRRGPMPHIREFAAREIRAERYYGPGVHGIGLTEVGDDRSDGAEHRQTLRDLEHINNYGSASASSQQEARAAREAQRAAVEAVLWTPHTVHADLASSRVSPTGSWADEDPTAAVNRPVSSRNANHPRTPVNNASITAGEHDPASADEDPFATTDVEYLVRAERDNMLGGAAEVRFDDSFFNVRMPTPGMGAQTPNTTDGASPVDIGSIDAHEASESSSDPGSSNGSEAGSGSEADNGSEDHTSSGDDGDTDGDDGPGGDSGAGPPAPPGAGVDPDSRDGSKNNGETGRKRKRSGSEEHGPSKRMYGDGGITRLVADALLGSAPFNEPFVKHVVAVARMTQQRPEGKDANASTAFLSSISQASGYRGGSPRSFPMSTIRNTPSPLSNDQ